jgi:uncharacterized membrane protein
MLKKIKAQSAIEFTIMIGFAIFFFILVLLAVEELILDQYSKKDDVALKSMALGIVNEINLAYSSSDGYQRNFRVTEDSSYSINLTDNFVYVKKNSQSAAYPAYPVEGNIQPGDNIIRKINGSVYLN